MLVTCASLLGALAWFGAGPAAAAGPAGAGDATGQSGLGPRPAYRCSFNVETDAFTGADGTASAIGWLGDHNSVITCLGGTFVIQDGPDGLFQDEGFGIYDGQRTTWADAEGYLPAQTTTFLLRRGVTASITEFADRIVVQGNPFVAVYAACGSRTTPGIRLRSTRSHLRLSSRSTTVRMQSPRTAGRPRLRRRLGPFRQFRLLARRQRPPVGGELQHPRGPHAAHSGTPSSLPSPRSTSPTVRSSTPTTAASSRPSSTRSGNDLNTG